MPEKTIPDNGLTEPVIAYRSFGVSSSGRQIKSTGNGTRAWARLSAPAAQCLVAGDSFYGMYAAVASMMALTYGQTPQCNPNMPDEPEHHEAPAFKCKCGYYAMKRVQDIPTAQVYARVALWGHIIEHDHGYRAQYAYPQVFFVRPDAKVAERQRIAALAQQYGCEVVPMPEELLTELDARDKAAKAQWSIPLYPPRSFSYDLDCKCSICADDPTCEANSEPKQKHEKGFSAQTMRHPFKAFMGGFTPQHRRK